MRGSSEKNYLPVKSDPQAAMRLWLEALAARKAREAKGGQS